MKLSDEKKPFPEGWTISTSFNEDYVSSSLVPWYVRCWFYIKHPIRSIKMQWLSWLGKRDAPEREKL
jgi:hypothetical protein